jgi:hypothetical protein
LSLSSRIRPLSPTMARSLAMKSVMLFSSGL